MKIILYALKLFLIFLTFLPFSCKKDSSTAAHEIVGSWNVSTYINTTYQNFVKISEDSYTYDSDEVVLVINANTSGKILKNGADSVSFDLERIDDTKYSIVQWPGIYRNPYIERSGDLEIVVDKNTLNWTSTFIVNTDKFQSFLVCNKIR